MFKFMRASAVKCERPTDSFVIVGKPSDVKFSTHYTSVPFIYMVFTLFWQDVYVVKF